MVDPLTQEANDLLKILADPQLYKSSQESLKRNKQFKDDIFSISTRIFTVFIGYHKGKKWGRKTIK